MYSAFLRTLAASEATLGMASSRANSRTMSPWCDVT